MIVSCHQSNLTQYPKRHRKRLWCLLGDQLGHNGTVQAKTLVIGWLAERRFL